MKHETRLEMISLVCSTGFLWQLTESHDWVRKWIGAFRDPVEMEDCFSFSGKTVEILLKQIV